MPIAHPLQNENLNSWEEEELQEHLAALPAELLPVARQELNVIWPVSHALCFAFLEQLPAALRCLQPQQVHPWVNETLDIYERLGLRAAHSFMANVQSHTACELHGHAELPFTEIQLLLNTFCHGLAGRQLKVQEAKEAGTDTTTIFLPGKINLCATKRQNQNLYKLLTSYQWAFGQLDLYGHSHAALGLLSQQLKLPADTEPDKLLGHYLATFEQPRLSQEIYLQLKTIQASLFLCQQLPGLMRDNLPFFDNLPATLSGSPHPIEQAHLNFLQVQQLTKIGPELRPLLSSIHHGDYGLACLLELTTDIYQWWQQQQPKLRPQPLLMQGKFHEQDQSFSASCSI